jgi:mannose-6-phosphate isomerase class I
MTRIYAEEVESQFRKSSQFQMPAKLDVCATPKDEYNIYPVCSLGDNKIFNGYKSLGEWIIKNKVVVIDGYVGVFWDRVLSALDQYFTENNLTVSWIKTVDFLKPADEIENLISPFLGTDDAVWGSRCTLSLTDLYSKKLTEQTPDDSFDINIIIGCGAKLVNWNAPIIYIDLPKNELQYRMRAKVITNLGSNQVIESSRMYKRFYFVDWVLLNAHKKEILDQISVIADGQWADDINWMHKADLAKGLYRISRSAIRVRPWFEPGAWGGQWIKNNIKKLNKDVINYAWSFELIVPENGLVFESDGNLLEVSFDFLMFSQNEQVLGRHAEQFKDEFPIRFDFLDTCNGGNLSIQCHPKLKYIQEKFGENITQDETYYILDCEDNACVYLGFQENINPKEFRDVLEESRAKGEKINIENYVQSHKAKKHDLFLIPNSTIHSAGAGNMVLEISATPYIFTFKMYDWLRLDLDGNPRPINIDHAFENLDFERKGNKVFEELISKPSVIELSEGHQLVHIPTHADHFYDVHRIEFTEKVTVETNDMCHVMMLVEGQSILLETADGSRHVFAYAETFIIPAAAISYQLTNLGKGHAKVIKAFLK